MIHFHIIDYIPARITKRDYPSCLLRSFKAGDPTSIKLATEFLVDCIRDFNFEFPSMLMVAPSSTGKFSSIHKAALALLDTFPFEDGINGFKKMYPTRSFCSGAWRKQSVIFDSVELRCDVSGRDIVLLDDIRTTGTTLDALSKMLMDAGAKSVTCLTLAQTVRLDAM